MGPEGLLTKGTIYKIGDTSIRQAGQLRMFFLATLMQMTILNHSKATNSGGELDLKI